MQLVLSNNRVIAHGENFLPMGGVVINTETGARYENATIAECENCPSDLGKVGYEYHGGVFKPCAPFGKGNNNGYFMEVCSECAVPRSSGIPIKHGIKKENIDFNDVNVGLITLLWENASPDEGFNSQKITLESSDYTFLIVEACESNSGDRTTAILYKNSAAFITGLYRSSSTVYNTYRKATVNADKVDFENAYRCDVKHTASAAQTYSEYNGACVPVRIYGVKL